MSDDCRIALGIAETASRILLTYYKSNLQVQFKADQFDPVTHADKESDAYIRAALAQAFPADAILSEEHPEQPATYDGRVWVVDPLDGTKEFVAGRDCFGVVIGLLTNGQPTIGIINVPARGTVFYAEAGKGAYRIRNGQVSQLQVSIVSSLTDATHLSRYAQPGDIRPIEDTIKAIPFKQHVPEGSISIKLARIASGEAEAFVHTNNRAGKWDTIAGQLLLEEAGGYVCDLQGKPLDYTQPERYWRQHLVATNSQLMQQAVLAAFP